MKVLVTGINGQLGHDVMGELKKRGHEAVGVAAEADIKYTIFSTDVCAAYAPD